MSYKVAVQSGNVNNGTVVHGLECLHSGSEEIQGFFRLCVDVNIRVCQHVNNTLMLHTMAK